MAFATAGEDLQTLPRTQFAGLDIGGTNVRLRYCAAAGAASRDVRVRSADYGSLEDALHDCFRRAGCLPRYAVAGVAGRLQADGDVRMTNQPQWPVFRRRAFGDRLGMMLTTVNDMMATVCGVAGLGAGDATLLTEGVAMPATRVRLAVSVGSGVGSAATDAAGTPHPAESGHITWQPVTAVEHDYLTFLQRGREGQPTSVEHSISGLFGFERMYDFGLLARAAAGALAGEVAAARQAGQGIGPVITTGAVGGDPSCRELMRLFGGIFGQYLRNLALIHLSGGAGGAIYLTSSVLQAPGVARLLVTDTPFLDRFRSAAAAHADLMREVPVSVVDDPHIAVKGALALAERSTPGL